MSVHALIRVVIVQVSKMVILMKSQLEKGKGEGVKRQIRFDCYFGVPKHNMGVMLWNNELDVSIVGIEANVFIVLCEVICLEPLD